MYELELCRDDLITADLLPAGRQSSLTPSTKAELDCRNWLIPQMRDSPERAPKTKAEMQADALRKSPRLSERGFDRAWKAALEVTGAKWNAPGPPGNPRTK